MEFTGKELTAIVKLGKTMAMADGELHEHEIDVMVTEVIRFGVPPTMYNTLLKESNLMDFSEAITIIDNLDVDRKKYVSSYLGTILISDGEIDEKEVALWRLITKMCGLPKMDVRQAVNNMNNL